MCGICGIIDWREPDIDADQVVKMRDLMVARGPDDSGLHVEPGVVLGHRRLSIIDLSADGHQPMPNEDQTIWLVFNGEIYNFLELRKELLAAGHCFRSRTDAEVVIHGYEEWGTEGLTLRLRGMFAMALWDRRTRHIHLIRDPLGKKPLFYSYENGRLVFSSDIRSLWWEAGGNLTLNERAVDEFLYYKFISQGQTIFNQVNKVLPGHRVTFDGRTEKHERYWRPDYTRKQVRTLDEWLEGVDHYLRTAVRRRLVSDVPLGGFLSGGVDSSCICALMAAESQVRPRTFTVGFSNAPRFDERRYSRLVAHHIQSVHTELVAEAEIAPLLSEIVWNYGEPFGDSSMLPTYLIAREARKHVTVVLTGDGGDEAFAGYSRHLRAGLFGRYPKVYSFVGKGLITFFTRLLQGVAPQTLLTRNLDQYSRYLSGDPSAFAVSTCWFDGLRRNLYSDTLMKRLDGWHPGEVQEGFLKALNGPGNMDRALEYLLLTTLPGDYLTKLDVATMSHSLEARCPFLDIDLLSFAMTIPAEVLVEGHLAKAMLKRYAARLVPPEVVYRKKHGFSIPIRQWFRTDWKEPLQRFLLSKPALERGYFKPQSIRQTLEEHISGKRNHGSRIWTLLVFEIWNRLFVDKTMKPGDPVLL